MNKSHILLITAFSCLIGCFFYIWYNQILVIRVFTATPTAQLHHIYTKKKCPIYYPAQSGFKEESYELVITDDMAQYITILAQRWLTLLHEEQIILQKITVEQCMTDATQQTAYLSCDKSIFPSHSSTHHKLMVLESLFKTVRENHLPVTSIQLLVHNKPLEDIHLDCSRPFPVTGYLRS